MGGSKNFAEKGEFKYKSVGTIYGIKILVGVNGEHNLPMFSGKSVAYLRVDDKGRPRTIRVFQNQEAAKDIDWMHGHGKFKEGEIHVHEIKNKKRTEPREPTTKERMLAEKVRQYERER